MIRILNGRRLSCASPRLHKWKQASLPGSIGLDSSISSGGSDLRENSCGESVAGVSSAGSFEMNAAPMENRSRQVSP